MPKKYEIISYGKQNVYKVIILATTRAPEIIDPCNPTPCGVNAQCSARNGAASCNCYSGMEGDPYIACKHECTVNTECSSHLACINNKCRDPCPGVCGSHAYCRVTNHFPICKCDAGYIGDPFTSCQIKPTRKKSYFSFELEIKLLYISSPTPPDRKSGPMQSHALWVQCTLQSAQ